MRPAAAMSVIMTEGVGNYRCAHLAGSCPGEMGSRWEAVTRDKTLPDSRRNCGTSAYKPAAVHEP